MMGAGKSTVGKLMSAKLGLEFLDTDKRIAQRAGTDIPTIFDIEGEAGFREREEAVLAEIGEHAPMVVATGGGAVLREVNRNAMRATGTIVYLAATADELWRRLRRDRTRPLLRQADPEGTLRSILGQREKIYRELAHHTVISDSQGAPKLADRIIQLLAR